MLKKLAKIRAIACDIDGTLTDEKQRLSCVAIEALRELEESGIPVILASGNTLCVLDTLRRYIGCSGALIAENGGVVKYKNFVKVTGNRLKVLEAAKILKTKFKNKIVESWTNRYRLSDYAFKSSCSIDELKSVLPPTVRLVYSGYAYHIIDSKIDKGKGLHIALKLMGLPKDAVLAIGDSDIDVELLKVSGLGVAVRNSTEVLKKVADYITTKDSGEGVAEIVRLLLRAKKRE